MKNKEMVQELYTQKNSLYHRLFFGFFQYDKGIRAFFEKGRILNPGAKILDAGCGSGMLTKTLFKLGMEQKVENLEFFAFDITKAMLDIFNHWITDTKTNNHTDADHISVIQADVLKMNELPDSWDEFDLIVSSGMLEYLDESEIRSALSNLKNRLGGDGKLFLFITKSNIITKYLIEKLWKASSYRKNEMLNILGDAGFEHIKLYRFPARFWYLNFWGFIFEAGA